MSYQNFSSLMNFSGNKVDHFAIKGNGADIKFIYPEILNITLDNSLIIRYITPFPSLYKTIKLSKDLPELNWEDLIGMKVFIIQNSIFLNSYRSNYNGVSSIYYRISKINILSPFNNTIIIDDNQYDNNEVKTIGLEGKLYFIMNHADDELNIFKPLDIDEKTIYETIISENGNEYNAKSINEN